MTQQSAPVHTGDNAKVWTGIRDIPIWAGESSTGNQLPLGPYRTPELVTIGTINVPAIFWVTHHTQSPHVLIVLCGAPLLTAAIVLAMRVLLPKARPRLSTRAQFLYNAWLPRAVITSTPPTRVARSKPVGSATVPRTPDAASR
ncbi:hypothetical protein [Mycobacterium heckeshornense]|uniref:hypothetical protein n=1 Tax=Mycobacterium heckeshornense TaxID=110505 RepID=UPI0006625D42|nr:hypothetical protein [Mycobacterium heckeshornense]KMV22075.1 hypothetical protein ACT16_13210 [Mycobacterium heckeshornense]